MTQTVKFSQFLGPVNAVASDIFVGLRGGKNTQFYASSAGGGGSTIATIEQPAHGLTLGQWVTISPSALYVPALGTSAENAEVVGVVIEVIDVNSFVVQQAGYVTSTQAVFAALDGGSVYFLDTVTSGNMVLVDATINGQVSRPLFYADSATSGWVLPYRGLIVGGAAPDSDGGGNNLVDVTQVGHGLVAGDIVRLSGSVTYVKAQGNTLANSQAVGVVVNVVNANQFVLQTNGYYTNSPIVNTGPFSVDDLGAPLVAATVYYLSATVAGKLSATNPSSGSLSSKPFYISEQTWGGTGTNAGYILEQRPISFGLLIYPNAYAMALLFGR